MIIIGKGVSEGVAVGRARLLKNREVCVKPHLTEKERLASAVEELAREFTALTDGADKTEREILNGHLACLRDIQLIRRLEGEIENGKSAGEALRDVSESFCRMFSGSAFLKERAYDIKSVCRSLTERINGEAEPDCKEYRDVVLIAESVTPELVIKLRKAPPTAVVCEEGGALGHSAILLRAAEIPAVFKARGVRRIITDGDSVCVNGYTGEIRINEYENRASLCNHDTKINAPSDKLIIYANVSSADEAKAAAEYGAQGIGLFRTEFLFQSRIPSEEEQMYEYIKAAENMRGKPVTIRTLDAGDDKKICGIKSEKRGVSFCLENRRLFKMQLRAVMRAGLFKNIKMLLPFVKDINEIKAVRLLLEECSAELEGEKLEYKVPPLGVMIETPSAAEYSDLLAVGADFFSVGTNDLTAGILKKRREDISTDDVFAPPVLSAIEKAVKSAKKNGIEAVICGEAATDLRLLHKLLLFGADGISVSPAFIPRLKGSLY